MIQEPPLWMKEMLEAEKKPRRKPGPKPKANPVEPEPVLHVKINLTGSVEFNLEGDQAAELKGLLEKIELEKVLDFLDPWSSGVELTSEVGVTETPTAKRWLVDEAADVIESIIPFEPWMLK